MAPSHRSKALPAAQQEHARALARRIVRDECEGNISAAARRLGISQSMLHEFLGGTRGAGQALLSALAAHLGTTQDAVLGLAPIAAPKPLGRCEGWAVARATGEAMHPDIPADAWDTAEHVTIPGGAEPVDVALAAGVARELHAFTMRQRARK